MKHVLLTVVIAVTVVITVPRNQREASALLVRSGLRLIELGLSLVPRKSRLVGQDEREPDSSVEDTVASCSFEVTGGCGKA